jgi:hypothetical protein
LEENVLKVLFISLSRFKLNVFGCTSSTSMKTGEVFCIYQNAMNHQCHFVVYTGIILCSVSNWSTFHSVKQRITQKRYDGFAKFQ